jgi:hypothetical protein
MRDPVGTVHPVKCVSRTTTIGGHMHPSRSRQLTSGPFASGGLEPSPRSAVPTFLRRTAQAAFAGLLLLLPVTDTAAQSRLSRGPADGTARPSTSQHINAGTLGVVSGGADGTYIRIAADLANVLDGDDLRILPVIGRGSLQNLRDIMFLRGIDIGIVQMDALQALRTEGLLDAASQRLRYIARLYNEEVHVLAGRAITDLRQLDGKKVNIDIPAAAPTSRPGSSSISSASSPTSPPMIRPPHMHACAPKKSRPPSTSRAGRSAPSRNSRARIASIFSRSHSRARSPRPISRPASPGPITQA